MFILSKICLYVIYLIFIRISSYPSATLATFKNIASFYVAWVSAMVSLRIHSRRNVSRKLYWRAVRDIFVLVFLPNRVTSRSDKEARYRKGKRSTSTCRAGAALWRCAQGEYLRVSSATRRQKVHGAAHSRRLTCRFRSPPEKPFSAETI